MSFSPPLIVRMLRNSPEFSWGFRLSGGTDFNAPLTITGLAPGGLAERHGLLPGDLITRISGDSTASMTHQQAQQSVIRCANDLEFEVVRGLTSPTGGGMRNNNSNSVKQFHDGNFSPTAPAPYQSWSPVSVQGGGWRVAGTGGLNSPTSSPSPKSVNFATPLVSPPPLLPAQPPPPTSQAKKSSNSRQAIDATMNQMPGERPPLCAVCHQPIPGSYLLALNQTFCPDHFRCGRCQRKLQDCGFMEEAGGVYCEPCYALCLAPRCAKCSEPVTGAVVTAMDRKWHPHCFVCTHCRQPITSGSFRIGDDTFPYCERDWADLFQNRCDRCGYAVEPNDRFIEAFKKTFHAECFCCAACQTCLEGKPFFAREGRAFCKEHAHAPVMY